MTTTETTAAPKRGRARATIELPAASSTTSAVDAIANAPSAGAQQVLVEHLHLHPLNPAHRHDAGFEGLAELIRAQGEIREPLLVRAHPLIPEAFEVLSGARRLAAAQMLGMLMVPVRVVDVDDATAVAEVLAGNLERADFTESEEAALVQGSLDLGVSEADLATTLGRPRSWISRRRDVAALDPAARRVVDAAPEVDLVRAAAVAEFADDPEVYADLVEGIADDAFDHAVERARHDRGRAAMRQQRVDEILASDPGMTILDERPSTWQATDPAKYLTGLSATAGGRQITPAEHESCAGRAVIIDVLWYGAPDATVREEHYCLTWKTSGHYARHATQGSGATSGPMTDEQKAERKHLVETNKAAEAAQVVRRRWLGEFLTSDKMPKNAVAATLAFLEASYGSNLEWTLARELYGKTWSDSPAKAANRLLALGCAASEAQMPKDYWRHAASKKNKRGSTRYATYLTHLAEWGYALAPHEQDVVDGAAAAKAAD
ncbi:ParB/RepB/Spo0J family partition protein [Sanguibacter sp. HDW7]|uniref:ParB/RepB/Spo0J family partition protein n=1 Tax=Sanguibacter sp. HDW7 TaxID=2714931 RepID=UPI00140E4500|nr:ParB/RepB/Spo0J family partition protein [Sanguibacter sp. HDW7]QIK83087.1 ParB/RepB/Spo0J family partition protein [Sanguibacter sp. HDW7]